MKEEFMRRAIELAKSAMGHTSPNPMVGCVVVKDGRIISEACHERYGEYHAERNALLKCNEDTKGAELYVTLEPCCHYGKTPPCTDIIIEKGISKVYIGSMDSNPLVAGQGVKILKQHNIEVECGILEEECRKMNEVFFHFISTNLPFVAVKYAMTLDGKIAAYTGDSKWVTSEESRNDVQYLRKKYTGIMVGINTVLEDNPMLNCRIEEGVNPVRIILDSNVRIPEECNIVKTSEKIKTIIAYCNGDEFKIERLKNCGIKFIRTAGKKVDLKELMCKLGEMKVDSVLIEGGASINASAFESGIVNKVYAYIAPKVIMGKDSKSPVGGEGIPLMKDAVNLKNVSVKRIADDILITGYVK